MRNYRDNWFKVGAVLAMVVAGILALLHRRLSRQRLFSALNFAALLVHQFEEYGVPGYFPGQFNAAPADCLAHRRWRESWSSILRASGRSLRSNPLFSSPGAVLVGSDDGCIDHGVLVVRIVR